MRLTLVMPTPLTAHLGLPTIPVKLAGRRVRVLYVGPDDSRATGSSMVFRDLVLSLGSTAVDFALVPFNHTQADRLSALDVRRYSRSFSGYTLPSRILARVKLVRKAYREFKPDVVVVDLRVAIFLVCVMRALRLLRVPLIVRWGAIVRARSHVEVAVLRLKVRLLLKYADAVVVPSRMVRDDLVERFGVHGNYTHVIPNALDLSRFASAEKAGCCLDRAPVLMMIGSLSARKDPVTLLRAVAVLRDRGISVFAHFVGDGPLKNTLESMARDMGIESCVRFVGTMSDPSPYYRAADIVVCCSLADGFNITLLEAVYFKKPIIYADTPVGFVDVLKENGLGVAFSPEDAMQLATAIEDVLAGRQGQVDSDKYEAVASSFSIQRFAEAYYQLFVKTIESTKRASSRR